MIGIYKITSPTGRIYIGQSTDVKRRLNAYKRLQCKSQPKLFLSLEKHGAESHLFEIIELCEESELNNRERYWQDYFNCCTSKHLNCRITTSDTASGKLSEDHRRKIGESNKGRKPSELSRKLASERGKAQVGDKNPFFGRKHSKETLQKIQQSRPSFKGANHPLYGVPCSEKTKAKQRASHIGKGLMGDNPRAKMCIDINTGVFYSCVKEAADLYGLNRHNLNRKLRGERRNDTQFRLV